MRWAFTTDYASNWHPLTWLSHMLDFQLFGFHAGGHHFTNLLFHIANTLLLFKLLRDWTGSMWRSAFVAALFAWHPLHVESVAWVAERKDVLSAFFFFLSLLAYGKFAAAASRRYYAWSLILFALGLLCKPMLVTLPLVLLLVDYWPLGRIAFPMSPSRAKILLWEKTPFFLLSAASCVITVFAQKKGNAINSLTIVPLSIRFANAVFAYGRYICKLFWPVNLAVIYPYPRQIVLLQVVVVAVALVVICLIAGFLAKKNPPLIVGWLWFVITLVPVIGLVQVGEQAIADRYTYIPSIGIFVILAWEVPRLIKSAPALCVLAMVALIACLAVTAHQIPYWQNSVTLFSRAIAVTQANATAECNLGAAFAAKGQNTDAMLHEHAALRIRPDYPEAENNLGQLLAGEGRWDDAASHLQAALKDRPQYDQARCNLGLLYLQTHRVDDAITQFRQAIRDDPHYAMAMADLGLAFAQQGHLNEAIDEYRHALAIAPNDPYTCNMYGRALEAQNKLPEAAAEYAEAISLKPDFAEAHENLGAVLTLAGNFPQAEAELEQATKLQPASASTHYTFGNTYLREHNLEAAADQFSEALRLKPDYFEANFNLALTLTQLGRTAEAIAHYREVVKIKPQNVAALQKLAWLLATDSDAQLRNGVESLEFANKAIQLAPDDPSVWDAKGAALAETGNYASAAKAASKALEVAPSRQGFPIAGIQARLKLYQSGMPYHEPGPTRK